MFSYLTSYSPQEAIVLKKVNKTKMPSWETKSGHNNTWKTLKSWESSSSPCLPDQLRAQLTEGQQPKMYSFMPKLRLMFYNPWYPFFFMMTKSTQCSPSNKAAPYS